MSVHTTVKDSNNRDVYVSLYYKGSQVEIDELFYVADKSDASADELDWIWNEYGYTFDIVWSERNCR